MIAHLTALLAIHTRRYVGRAARPLRRSRVRHQEPAGTQPGAPVTRPVRQGHGHPAGGCGRAGDRRRLDRQGETPPRAEPARPRHRLRALPARCPGSPVRLLRLVRPERRHPRTAQPRTDHLPVGGRDHLRGPDRRHERDLREPEPARQARSPPGVRIP